MGSLIVAVGPPCAAGTPSADIAVGAPRFDALFSPWDYAPLAQRTLHPDLQTFLQRRALALRESKGLRIAVHLPAGERDAERERVAAGVFREHMRHTADYLGKTKRRGYLKALVLVVFGAATMVPAWFISQVDPLAATLLGEVVYIVGWVLIWEAVFLLFFTHVDIRKEMELDRRVQEAPVVFVTAEGPPGVGDKGLGAFDSLADAV
ncbi:hypothetical protein DFJ74DRAFT_711296 [Hyaloraphidium curvatum]|nr:hypothetical protein DFJ74DRAFT_711296 [Hyaloraphidium curvatum]